MKVKSLSCAWLFVAAWTVAYQAPPSTGFSRQEHWSGCHFLLQGIFPTRGSSQRPYVSCTGRWVLYHCASWKAREYVQCLLNADFPFSCISILFLICYCSLQHCQRSNANIKNFWLCLSPTQKYLMPIKCLNVSKIKYELLGTPNAFKVFWDSPPNYFLSSVLPCICVCTLYLQPLQPLSFTSTYLSWCIVHPEPSASPNPTLLITPNLSISSSPSIPSLLGTFRYFKAVFSMKPHLKYFKNEWLNPELP